MFDEKNVETATLGATSGMNGTRAADGADAAGNGAAGIGCATGAADAMGRGGVVAVTVEFGGVPYAPYAAHGVERYRSRRPRALRVGWPGTDRAWVEGSVKASQRVFSAVYYNDLVE